MGARASAGRARNDMTVAYGRRCKVVLVVLLMWAAAAHSQLNSNAPAVTLSATLSESLTVGLSGTTQTWSTGTGNALTGGSATNPGNAAITVTTSWALQSARNTVKLYAFFASTNALIGVGDATQHITSSQFQINVNGGGATSVSQTNAGFGAAGASLVLFTQNITGANKVSNRSDTLTFNIDLSGTPQLPADTYNGTLTIQAQAAP